MQTLLNKQLLLSLHDVMAMAPCATQGMLSVTDLRLTPLLPFNQWLYTITFPFFDT
jgi:hypothetical protein